MKRRIALVVVLLLAVGWFAARWRGASVDAAEAHTPRAVTAAPAKAVDTAGREVGPTFRPSTVPPRADAAPAAPAPAARPAEVRRAVNDRGVVSAAIPMSLQDVLQPGNGFLDPKYGVAAVYPEGWTVREAVRWGENQRENTVFFTPPEGSKATPSMYYQEYREPPPPRDKAEALLREMAQKKEEARSNNGKNDYRNDPGSFVFREVDGHPTLSYFATYSRGDQVQAEYFTRILGEKGYVMFFVRGPVADVQALIPPVYQMSGTVKPPH